MIHRLVISRAYGVIVLSNRTWLAALCTWLLLLDFVFPNGAANEALVV